MSTGENKAIARRILEELFAGGNLAVADEVIAADLANHNLFPGEAPGREGVKQVVALFHTAFPDIRFTVEDLIAEGDRVVDRWIARGTHRGEFMGLPPTGQQVTLTGIDIMRVAGGKVVEIWHNEDALGLMQQLGAIPAPGQAPAGT
jgi:steroid delta-isomerase-like uncharacterized protein